MTRRRWLAAGTLAAALLAVASLGLGLNGDVQYVLGGLRVHDPGDPLRFVDTFTHRPIAYRALLSGLSDLVDLVGIGPGRPDLYEGALRILGIGLAAGTGVALWRALRERIGEAEAGAVGLGAGLALGLAPNFDYLQPEWFAGAFLGLGVAAGIGIRRGPVAGAVSGALLTLAVAVKLATAPLAICGLVLIALVDRRRALLVAAGGVLAGAAWLGLVTATPRELRWMGEMAALNPHSPLRDPLGLTDAVNAIRALGSKLAVSPVLALVPASLVVIGRTATGRARWQVPLALLLVAALATAPLLIQAQWFLYHLAHLPPLGAGIVAFAVARSWRAAGRPSILLVGGLAAIGLWSAVALSLPPDWRDANAGGVVLGLLAVSLGLAAVAPAWPMRRAARADAAAGRARVAWGLGAAAAAFLAVAPALLPSAAWSPVSGQTPYTNGGWAESSRQARHELADLAQAIPPGEAVLYLAYGTVAYHVGARTGCVYPSPLWVQRTAFIGSIRGFDSYAENLRCIADGGEAYALVQPAWLRPERIDPEALRLIEATWDCDGAPQRAGVLLCRRR